MQSRDPVDVAATLWADVEKATSRTKRLKLRTLLGKFGYSKRSDSNTAEITQHLTDVQLTFQPPIVRFGEHWDIDLEDWIYLSSQPQDTAETIPSIPPPPSWNADGWFEKMTKLEFRTEKEVEIKFIVPLLTRLGYNDDDRFDGMPVPAAHGSRSTTLVIDFAVFNNDLESLRNQPLLTVEAKREDRLKKQQELVNAHNQAKSYSLWTQCDFFMVTDSRTIQAFRLGRGRLDELNAIFACERHELLEHFAELYGLLSKDALTRHYLAKQATTDETH